jgi:hypothetical protein
LRYPFWYRKNYKTLIFNIIKNNLKKRGEVRRLRIKKDKTQFEFRLNDSTLLTTTLPKQVGNYFGFQVENNFQGSNWIIEKYKLKEF